VAALTIFDAYPIVAYLVREPAGVEVKELLGQGDAVTTSLNIAEAVDVACRVYGASEPAMRNAIELLVESRLLDVAAPDATDALRAAELRIAYYRRRERPLSLADCFLVAAATREDHIATSDPAVAEVAREEGIAVLPLPDSSGRRP
jgi:predicted nucleic acid-binding protein